jgi:hypothetical protein
MTEFNRPFVETKSGKKINPLNPEIESIDIEDIAHALSMKCRFTGHTRLFYSIAQHSVMVSEFCPQEDALAGLLHDSAEAYLADIAGPIKPYIIGFKEIEERLLSCIFLKFDVEWPLPNSVRYIDERMLITEGHALMNNPESWGVNVQPYDILITPWTIEKVKEIFLNTFWTLYTYKKNRK